MEALALTSGTDEGATVTRRRPDKSAPRLTKAKMKRCEGVVATKVPPNVLPIAGPNDIEFSGEKEGAQRLTPSPLQG